MDTRRDFMKKVALISGASVIWSVPESIEKALAIAPDPGSSFLDAEHIVILMQENRSFDHAYGSLRGVRGFNDRHVHLKPDGNPVWVQVSKEGVSYAPCRLNMKDTNITWTGCLPHNWWDQVDARNNGAYDKWLEVKPSGYEPLADKPITLGHYTREDIPFYYALADAFTICDQNFCSSLTGTTPNRLFLWTGTIRAEQNPDSPANVLNDEADHVHEVSWPTFPERLEAAGVSWKVYQNELDIYAGLTDDEDSWLGNFNDNPLEFMTQYRVRFSPRRRAYIQQQIAALQSQIDKLGANPTEEKDKKELSKLQRELAGHQKEAAEYNDSTWNALSDADRALHEKGLVCNTGDPDFRTLETLTYSEGGKEHQGTAPKGDIFYQFRKDVESGNLPTVSWLVGSEHLSDHPGSAWFGAWYVSETLDILTQNPEIWKKTIFILNYDENDGYFDHVPPFVAPNPYKPDSGKVSPGVDAKVEFLTKEQDEKFRPGYRGRESSIGLGYRVPLLVASPWTRGGCVCSEVFDHTSVIRFVETFINRKTGKDVTETNISSWRRTVTGDLTSVFQDEAHDQGRNPEFLNRNKHIEAIYKAQFYKVPSGFKELTADEVSLIREDPRNSPDMARQEPGTRKSCPLPYMLHVDGRVADDGTKIRVRFEVGAEGMGEKRSGSPFMAYQYNGSVPFQERAYAVKPGDVIEDEWDLLNIPGGKYHIRVAGPNGFLREFKGAGNASKVDCEVRYDTENHARRIKLRIENPSDASAEITIADLAYGSKSISKQIPARKSIQVTIDAGSSHGWYDLSVTLKGSAEFERRLAGRIENGDWSISDPAMA